MVSGLSQHTAHPSNGSSDIFRPGMSGCTLFIPATDDSLRSHILVLTNIAGEWKWDWLESLSPEVRREREAALQQKTVLLDSLAQKLRDGTLTNSDEAFRLFMTDPAQR